MKTLSPIARMIDAATGYTPKTAAEIDRQEAERKAKYELEIGPAMLRVCDAACRIHSKPNDRARKVEFKAAVKAIKALGWWPEAPARALTLPADQRKQP